MELIHGTKDRESLIVARHAPKLGSGCGSPAQGPVVDFAYGCQKENEEEADEVQANCRQEETDQKDGEEEHAGEAGSAQE